MLVVSLSLGCSSSDPEAAAPEDASVQDSQASDAQASDAQASDAADACTSTLEVSGRCCEGAESCAESNCRLLVAGGCDLRVTVCARCEGSEWRADDSSDACFFGCKPRPDVGAGCGQIVDATGSCPAGCHRTFASTLAPWEMCLRTRYVCVSDDAPDTAALVCRVHLGSGTIFNFGSGHATDPARDPGWRTCDGAEQSRVNAAMICADAG